MTSLPTTTPRFSIVLPCYNEAATLPLLFARFAEILGDRADLEVIFVNNGSQDNSAAVFDQEMAKSGRQFANVVSVPVNQGYGYGILAGLQATRGEFIGWTHADSQYDPKIVIDGFARLATSAEPHRTLLQGRRVSRPAIDGFFTAGMSVVSSLMLGIRVNDINAQPKLFPRGLLELLHQAPTDFSLDLYALVVALRSGYQIIRLPVDFRRRTHGDAKGGGSLRLKWKLTKRTWSFLGELRCRLRDGSA
jgi:glycosyltransferase involved in cell wall biosynthesis